MSFSEGESIITQGEEGDMFYILNEGKLDFEVDGVGLVLQLEGGVSERRYFGELALLYNAPRAATVKATSSVTTFALGYSSLDLCLCVIL